MIAVAAAADEKACPGQVTTHRRRRIIAMLAALVLAAGALTTVLTLRHYDRQYGPIESGPFGGPIDPDRLTGGIDRERFAVEPGGTVQYMESLANRGSHSVKITSIETDPLVTQIRWSVYHVVGGGSAFGTDTPWRDFPAIVPGHYGIIRLRITIRRPLDCKSVPHGPGGAVYYGGGHVVHWDSLLGSHTTVIDDGFDQQIRVC
jgi:hypothetical protein